MATVTVSSSTTLALLSYAAGDDIVITGATTLTCDSDPSALPAIRSIRSTDVRSKFVYRNTNTTFSAGSLWRLPFENAGSVIGAGGTLAFSNGATCDIQGEWLTCYTATGSANETVLDASNVLGVDVDFPYFIQCETGNGTGVYKPIPVVVVGGPGDGYIATSDTARFGTGEVGRVLFYNRSTRLLQTGNGTNGSLIAAGVRFRIPNTLIWMPAFTLTVAAGGWTTATGSQNVTSSTNAPIGTGYVINSELIAISSLPSGTTVNVNSRASEGTTAAAHAAGSVAYCIPNRNTNMAGRIFSATGGNFILRRCFFSRWMIPHFSAFSSVDADSVGYMAANNGLEVGGAGSFSHTNGVILCQTSRINQVGVAATAVNGDFSLNGTSILGTVSTIGTFGSAGSSMAAFTTMLSIAGMENVRIWRMGCPTGVSFALIGASFTASTFKSGVGISGLELINVALTLNDAAVDSVSGLRYSSTNGPANTSTDDIAFYLGPSGKLTRCAIYDFDVISGGVAPYDAWFSINTNADNLIIHNKVSGSVRTVDCQSRTRRVCSVFNGKSQIFANAIFSNMRANGQTQFNSANGADCVIRNVRWSDLAGAALDTTSIQPVRGAVFDFPGGPVNANTGTGGLVTNQPDVQAVYACPNTWPGLAGGLYVGPVTAEQSRDLYEFTGTAYQNNSGAVFIETNGDTAIIKATSPVTGVSSVTGTAPTYYGNNATTGLTYEFRLCNWGADITALGWTAFTGGNVQSAFNALSGYSSSVGLNFQLRITATTTSANRVFQQCWVPVQMDTAYSPPVSTVTLGLVAATSGSTAAFYYGGSDTLIGSQTVSGGGTASVAAPYDFDGTTVAYRIRVRGLTRSSVDVSGTYARNGATAPTPQFALTGYVAGPYAGVSFNKSTKVATVTTGMTTQQLWSAWREYIVQVANFDVADTWSYPALEAPDWTITTSGGGSISGSYTDVNGANVSASISNIVSGSRILIKRTDTNVVLANAIVSGTTYGYTVQTATAIPINVEVRKGSSAPFYQPWSTTGSIDPVGGFAATANQIPD